MNLPSTDMVLCLYLLPDEVRAKEPIASLVRYSELLETAKFVEFWEAANLGGNELLDGVPGFDEAIREYMVGVLAITYQKIESAVFQELLALGEEHLGAFVGQSSGNMAVDGKCVVFTPNEHNQQRPKKQQETISFDSVLPVLDLLAAP